MLIPLLSLLLAGAAAGAERQLQVVGGGGSAVAVLISAAGPKCKGTVTAQVPANGVLDLSSLVDSGCWSCTDENAGLAVHARGRSVSYRSAKQVCDRAKLRVQLRPRRVVDLHIWPHAKSDIPRALDDVANTDWSLDRNLAGIALRPTVHWPNKGIARIDCNKPPAAGMFVPGALNVYYGGGRVNQSCETEPDEPQYIVIHDTPVLGDLAHELGHALGLKQDDHERTYDTGHTTNRLSAGFDCSNSMWEGTEVLTDHYSLGQAFWLFWSGSSFAARVARRMVPCSDEIGGASPCPAFSTRHVEARPQCLPCKLTVEEAKRVCTGDGDSLYGDSVRLCSPGELKSALRGRYNELVAHGAKTGSRDLDAFLRNWRKHLGLTLAIEATARAAKDTGERQEGLAFLEEQSRAMPGNRYVNYSIDRIRNDQYTPRCGVRSKPLPAELQ